MRVFSRGAGPLPWREGTVEAVRGDVGERDAVRAAVAGVDLVFHLAALLHQPPGLAQLGAGYERVNTVGARIVAEESARAGVRRLVFFSTISVYGPTSCREADEETVPAPRTPYASSKLLGERAVLECHGSDGLMVSVLRLAAVYGPRVKGNYLSLARAIEAGWFVPIGAGSNRRTLVHERDVAEAAWLAASCPQAAGRIYDVSDGGIHPLREIVSAIYAAVGRREPGWRIPAAPARTVAGIADAALRGLRRPPRFASMLDKYLEDVAVRADRIQRELGFRPRVELAAGWREVLGPGAREACL